MITRKILQSNIAENLSDIVRFHDNQKYKSYNDDTYLKLVLCGGEGEYLIKIEKKNQEKNTLVQWLFRTDIKRHGTLEYSNFMDSSMENLYLTVEENIFEDFLNSTIDMIKDIIKTNNDQIVNNMLDEFN